MYFCLSKATSFGLHRPSSDHYHKTFEIRSTIVQLQFALRDVTCDQVSLVSSVYLEVHSLQRAAFSCTWQLRNMKVMHSIFFQSLAQFCNLYIHMKFNFTYVTQMYSRLPPPSSREPYHLLNAEVISPVGPKFFDTMHISKATFTLTRKRNGFFEESHQFCFVEILQTIRLAWPLFTIGSYVKG